MDERWYLLISMVIIGLIIITMECLGKYIAYQKRQCVDCGTKEHLIINKYQLSDLLNFVIPTEFKCNYHYRLYHGIKHDDFSTELDDEEFMKLRKLNNIL